MYKNEKRYALVNGVLLDGTRDMAPQTGKVICVDGSRIAAVTDGAAPAGYETVDLGGQYVLPGLINLHVHLPASGKPKKKPSDPKKLVKLITSNGLMRRMGIRLCEGYAKMELLSGVTTIRTVGGVADFDTMIAAEKPDLIKLMITGGVMDAEVVGEPGVLRMQPALVKAACDKAHALGMKVAAHVESPEGVRVALENGVDSIEHGARPDADILRLFKERGAFQVSTISPAVPYALFDRSISHATYEQQANGLVVFEGIVALAKACLAEGIPVGLGTDTGCPYITHYDMWRELCYFVKYCGVTPAFALHSATLLNAELAGIADVTGSVEAGKAADLIVCPADPLADLTALRRLSMVIRDGWRLENPTVKKMPEVERELDKFL